MVRPEDPELKELLDQFVKVYVVQGMNDVDIGLFQFDYDLTWWSVFLNASDEVYSRYGGRDASDPEGRLSAAGLKYTMRQVLEHHRRQPPAPASARQPLLPRDAFQVKGKGCIHCHHVWEGLRRQAKLDGRFTPEMYHVYPLPENVGLTLDVDAGNRVAEPPKGPARAAGLEKGDVLDGIGKVKIFSQGDVMYALHLAPAEGKLPLSYLRAGKSYTTELTLDRGWKATDLSWRASVRRDKKGK